MRAPRTRTVRVSARRLLLIEPVLDGARYVDDCLRAHMTTQLACFNKVNDTRAVLREQLRRGEFVSVLGHEVGQRLTGPLAGLQLGRLLGAAQAAEIDLIHVPRTAGRAVPAGLTELATMPGVRLHSCDAPFFWDNTGQYWELPDELRIMSLGLTGQPARGESP